jgi:hypothetical protein
MRQVFVALLLLMPAMPLVAEIAWAQQDGVPAQMETILTFAYQTTKK